ncbi:actin family [Obelidium mucronatum]|nr:actin family [Obelidium mucronatum]
MRRAPCFQAAVGVGVDAQAGKKYIGEAQIFQWREGVEVKHAMHNGLVFRTWPLITEAAWNTRDVREKLVELAFEKFQTPAFYIAKSATMASFCAGKQTALVIDSGAETTSVVPVVDGFVLKKGMSKKTIRCWKRTNQINVVPHYMVKKKVPVDPGQKPPADVVLQRNATKSFHDLATQRVLTEFKETVAEVSPGGYQQQYLNQRPPKPFEFPDGYNNSFGLERFKLPEVLFNPATSPQFADGSAAGIQQLILSSLNACDPDVRATLFQNVVLCGGNTMIPGFAERLSNTMGHGVGLKNRIHTPGSPIERKYASWIGGSILASVGNFQQMWISKAEFEEKGSSVEKRLL